MRSFDKAQSAELLLIVPGDPVSDSRETVLQTIVLEHKEGGKIQQQAHNSCPTVDPPPPVEQCQHDH